MKQVLIYMMSISLLVCVGCAEQMDVPKPVAEVSESPWLIKGNEALAGSKLYAPCASCHMADGSGRSDGTIPRLAGQSERVITQKLQKIRNGEVTLPVMVPFARALSSNEIAIVAHYISRLPYAVNQSGKSSSSSNKKYAEYCSACHGELGQGDDDLVAPKLCGQHAAYLDRRLKEIENNIRGDADTAMILVLKALNQQTREDITEWLAAGRCENRDKNNAD